jgi:hypothetical protein
MYHILRYVVQLPRDALCGYLGGWLCSLHHLLQQASIRGTVQYSTYGTIPI